jgi:[protein-PII] uridylyltransferase
MAQLPKSAITKWRAYQQSGLQNLKAEFHRSPDIAKLFRQHVKLVDHMLISLWQDVNIPHNACLIAVGGYGRGEFYPHSDIDLLILTTAVESTQDAIEHLIGFFWDIGLNIGHSVRTIEECASEASKDITVLTNLIECRLLAGDATLFQAFLQKVQSAIHIADFFNGKLKEQDNRYAKFNDTAYKLEPNIKESPGGLRDLHVVQWLARSVLISQEKNNFKEIFSSKDATLWAWLISQKIVSEVEVKKIHFHQKKLQKLRAHLHFLSGRCEDRLLFDFQNELASIQGYSTNTRKRASEQLMQGYYRSVKFIQMMNEILMQSLHQLMNPTPIVIEDIHPKFETRNHLLETKSANLLRHDPEAIFEAFLLLQKHPDIIGMGANFLRNLQRAKHLVNQDFRKNPINKARFIEILSQPNGVNHTLRAMNRHGILGCYIPVFGKIVGQMQHDLFHVFTVDEHILNVLANLRRFSKPELKHEFPLCSRLFAEFDKPHLLYIAALFHDIAKGRNGDHSSLGKIDAEKFCRQHLLPKEDVELVAWLVDAHLKMSSTAQKSDLSDPDVIESFAQFIKNERRLTALYLLTVADIRGTSPAVWNAWKARLLESLFHLTKNALADQQQYKERAISSRRQEASTKLSKFGLKTSSYEPLWEKFGANYLVRHDCDEIVWHSRLLTPHLNTPKPIVRARLSPNGDGIQVMIYHKIEKALFASICNFFDRMGYSIAEAKIYTTEHHYVLDTFIILDSSGKSVSYTGLLKYIEENLTQKIEKNEALEQPLEGRINRQVKLMPLTTQVVFNEVADDHYQLEISTGDKPGLLAKLAHCFLAHEIEIHNAKINTMGNRVEDSFIISAKKGQKLAPEQLKKLKENIVESIK